MITHMHLGRVFALFSLLDAIFSLHPYITVTAPMAHRLSFEVPWVVRAQIAKSITDTKGKGRPR